MADIDPAAVRVAERRIAAANRAGLPTSVANRLRGETDEELAADAAELAAGFEQIGTTDVEGDFDVDGWIRQQARPEGNGD